MKAEKCPWCSRKNVQVKVVIESGPAGGRKYRLMPHLGFGGKPCVGGGIANAPEMYEAWKIKVTR